MDAPRVLNDIRGQDLAGFTFEHARGIAEGDSATDQPVVMTDTQQPIVCIGDDDLLDLVASHFTEPRAHGRPMHEVAVHTGSRTAYRLNGREPFAGTQMHVLTRDEYERLKDQPGAFSWRKAT